MCIGNDNNLLSQLIFGYYEPSQTGTGSIALIKSACALAVIGSLLLLTIHSASRAAIHNRLGHRKITVGLWAGLSAGSALSCLCAIPISITRDMYHHTGNDVGDILNFLFSTSVVSLLVIFDTARMGLETGCLIDACIGN